MKRVQKDIFFLPDAAIIFKIYPTEASQSVLRDYIELAGGMCLDGDEDDPFAIPVVDLNFLHANNMKSIKKPKNDLRDYFRPDFVYDSYLRGQIMDLNDYKIREFSGALQSSQYDANQIAQRELSWKDVINQMARQKSTVNKKTTSKKNQDQVHGTVIPLLPSQADPQSSSGSGENEDQDGQLMHPSQNHSDDDNINKEKEYDEIIGDFNINNNGEMNSKSVPDKSIPEWREKWNGNVIISNDNQDDTDEEIRILQLDAESLEDTPIDNVIDQNFSDNHNNNVNEVDNESFNVSGDENSFVGDELPCGSKTVKGIYRNSNENNSNNNNDNNNNTTAKSLADDSTLDDNGSDVEEEDERKKKKKMKRTRDAHSSTKKKNQMSTSRSRSSSRSSSSSSDQQHQQKQSKPKFKNQKVIESSDDDESSSAANFSIKNSSDAEKHHSDSDSDSTPKKKPKMNVKPKKKRGGDVKRLRRGAYVFEESVAILNFINRHGYHEVTGGILMWKKMEQTGKFSRTGQSMKEHFRKQIINNLKYYGCSRENRKKFREAAETRKRNKRSTLLHSQDYKPMLDAEMSSDGESAKKKTKKEKRGKSKHQKQDSDDDD